MLYPDPTIYSDHPILALDANAARFLDAMKDPEIQTDRLEEVRLPLRPARRPQQGHRLPRPAAGRPVPHHHPAQRRGDPALLACVKTPQVLVKDRP